MVHVSNVSSLLHLWISLTELRIKHSAFYFFQHEPPKGSSYAPNNYDPYSYSYYAEKSMIPRKAKVKRVPSYSKSYDYGTCKDEEQQWVGVDGFDACVADKGASIVCLVDEHVGYEYYGSSYPPPAYSSYSTAPSYPPYEYYKEIA